MGGFRNCRKSYKSKKSGCVGNRKFGHQMLSESCSEKFGERFSSALYLLTYERRSAPR